MAIIELRSNAVTRITSTRSSCCDGALEAAIDEAVSAGVDLADAGGARPLASGVCADASAVAGDLPPAGDACADAGDGLADAARDFAVTLPSLDAPEDDGDEDGAADDFFAGDLRARGRFVDPPLGDVDSDIDFRSRRIVDSHRPYTPLRAASASGVARWLHKLRAALAIIRACHPGRWRRDMSGDAIFFRSTVLLTIVAAASMLAACAKEGPAERAGKQIDEAMEEAHENLQGAAEEVAEAADDLGDAVREGAADMRKELPGELKKEAREMARGIKEACEDVKSEAGAKDTDC